eukprot:Sspe_Gene.103657::Locus_79488_Transcript_1_1_Confidence_1.000_Length_859::g.103657::m.103657
MGNRDDNAVLLQLRAKLEQSYRRAAVALERERRQLRRSLSLDEEEYKQLLDRALATIASPPPTPEPSILPPCPPFFAELVSSPRDGETAPTEESTQQLPEEEEEEAVALKLDVPSSLKSCLQLHKWSQAMWTDFVAQIQFVRRRWYSADDYMELVANFRFSSVEEAENLASKVRSRKQTLRSKQLTYLRSLVAEKLRKEDTSGLSDDEARDVWKCVGVPPPLLATVHLEWAAASFEKLRESSLASAQRKPRLLHIEAK